VFSTCDDSGHVKRNRIIVTGRKRAAAASRKPSGQAWRSHRVFLPGSFLARESFGGAFLFLSPRRRVMFSVQQKRDISDAVQKVLRNTGHPELPEGEIQFTLHVGGATLISWADIQNNGAITNPSVNPHNERQELASRPDESKCSGNTDYSLIDGEFFGE